MLLQNFAMKPHVYHEKREDRQQSFRVRIKDCPHLVTRRLAETLLCIALAVLGGPAILVGEEPVSFGAIGAEYERDVRPLLKHFCLECHSTKQKEGGLDLEQFVRFDNVRLDPKAWQKVEEMLGSGEMPPEDSEQLSAEQQNQLRGWVRSYLIMEARVRAGDPGPVVLRRLNNAEYTYTIRDLTGVELDPTREFPVDGAAGEGFTNTGNALVMSPALSRKYLYAGKEIARQAVLLPDGFRFSPRTTRREWTDEILSQIREFYGEFVESVDLGTGLAVGYINGHVDTRLGHAGRLPLEKYFAATLSEQDALTTGGETIETVARERGLNARYLGALWASLSASGRSLLLDDLRARWRSAKPQDAAALAADVTTWQKGLWTFSPVGLIGRRGGSTGWLEPINPLVTRQDLRLNIPASVEGEEKKEVVVSLVVTDAGDGNEYDYVVWQQPRLVAEGKPDILLRDVRWPSKPVEEKAESRRAWKAIVQDLDPAMFGKHPNGKAIDAASLCVRAPSVIKICLAADLVSGRDLLTTAVLDQDTGRHGSVQVDVVAGTPPCKSGLLPSEVTVKFSQVTQVFSEHRSVSFSRPILVRENSETHAALESAMNEHRSLFPAALCYTQTVPVDELHTTTLFYREDDHLVRLMLDDAQKSRLDQLWQELRYVSQSALMRVVVLEDLLTGMSGNGQDKNSQYAAIEPLRVPFNQRAVAFRKELVAAERTHVDALVDFANRAYRRPLTGVEASELRDLYRQLREQELPHDEAFRLTLARVFVATPFLFRLENAPTGTAAAAVSDWELAGRLSYFLWSSQPDDELWASAKAGRLTATQRLDEANTELLRQTRRMLTDARVRRLATEFACQWLDIYGFARNEEKSEELYPEFARLRGEMYEESVLFFEDMCRNDGSILDLLNADHAFLNESLAKHYGIGGVSGPEWRRVKGIRRQRRGGVLGMASVLAKQSGASRTSPILRGNWVSETLLGERLPKPPANVPQLSHSVPTGLTARQLIERHSSAPECAKCHARIDPYGFALEQYDAIGRLREKQADTKTKLVDGKTIEGIEGLRGYLLKDRRRDFVQQFCRKLLGYSLGRAVQLSDQPLLDEMQQQLAASGYRFGVAVETIVRSRQFREIRGRQMTKE